MSFLRNWRLELIDSRICYLDNIVLLVALLHNSQHVVPLLLHLLGLVYLEVEDGDGSVGDGKWQDTEG